MRKRTLAWITLVAGGASLFAVHVAARLVPLPNTFFTTGSAVVEFADGSPAHVFLSSDDKWRIDRSLDEIDPDYLRALIRLEDQRYYDHGGVDLIAVLRAALTNVWNGRVVSGASTITMQLVRVREPRPRTIGSKIVEAFRALQLEARFDKDRILAAYLTHVPYGSNVEGVEAASLAYFGHRADALSGEEIATLLAVPQNPTVRHPSRRNAARLKAARDEIARRLGLHQVEATEVPTRMRPFPRLAPHAARWLLQQHPRSTRLRTHLDRGAQQTASRILSGERSSLRARGIHNAAIVVVDHAEGVVKALIGNVDFWDEAHGGQIPGFAIPRSPGSALKPFIYALAVERGLALPEHLVLDVPVEYGTYAPDNYDGEFSGLVTLEDALSRSLNVPFVNLLAELGVERFVGSLRSWGVDSLVDEVDFYGLSAAIGGLEITPLEMAGLFSALAEDGRYRRPAILRAEEVRPIAAFAPGAAYLTRRALEKRDRPDFPARRRYTRAPANIHWKTGTSYGHRDAWAAGSNGRHTVVVWTGNFDNRPSVHLVGADAAGPILFDVLEALGDRARPRTVPPDLASVQVCALSGRLPSPGCPHEKRVLAPRAHVPTERCPYHVVVDVDVATGLAVNPTCRAGRQYVTRTFLAFPPRLEQHLASTQRTLPAPPEPMAGCGVIERLPPQIVSPATGKILALLPGVGPERQEVPLLAEGSGRTASWFVDGRFLGRVPMQERLWWTPSPGEHRLVVTDETGASAARTVRVQRL